MSHFKIHFNLFVHLFLHENMMQFACNIMHGVCVLCIPSLWSVQCCSWFIHCVGKRHFNIWSRFGTMHKSGRLTIHCCHSMCANRKGWRSTLYIGFSKRVSTACRWQQVNCHLLWHNAMFSDKMLPFQQYISFRKIKNWKTSPRRKLYHLVSIIVVCLYYKAKHKSNWKTSTRKRLYHLVI